MPDVLLLLLAALSGLVFSFLVATVFNAGGSSDPSLNRDLNQIIIQFIVQLSNTIFIPIKGTWSIVTTLTVSSLSKFKWAVFSSIVATFILLMHYYHYDLLSVIDDGWTCALIPLMRNVITPLLQLNRILFAIGTPIADAILIINGQLVSAALYTTARCSHVNLFRIFTELAAAIIASTKSLVRFFGVGDDDPNSNFFTNDFDIEMPINHTMAAVLVTEEAFACACVRFEPIVAVMFAVFEEPHVVAAVNNGFQAMIRGGQMIFGLLIKEYPDVHRVSFKLERAIVETGLALDSIAFKSLGNIIRLFSPGFKMEIYPTEGPFSAGAQAISGGVEFISVLGVNGPLYLLESTFHPDKSPFNTEVWNMDEALSYSHRSVYNGAVFAQWAVYVMEKLVTDTFSIGDVFTDPNTPLELNCDWARDVKEHKYVSIGYTVGCSIYNYGIIYTNAYAIAYGAVIELLTKSIFTQEQNAFRTLQRWEGPLINRNKVYSCEERSEMTAYDFQTNTYYKEGQLWTGDRGRCSCNRPKGITFEEGEPFYNPWCGQPNLNFDVFAPMDALVMHVSHGILGPGFGDTLPYMEPMDGLDINIDRGPDKEPFDHFIAFPFPIPPLTRTAIESLRIGVRVLLSFGDIVTGHFFNYPINCGHGLNKLQMEARFNSLYNNETALIYDNVDSGASSMWDSFSGGSAGEDTISNLDYEKAKEAGEQNRTKILDDIQREAFNQHCGGPLFGGNPIACTDMVGADKYAKEIRNNAESTALGQEAYDIAYARLDPDAQLNDYWADKMNSTNGTFIPSSDKTEEELRWTICKAREYSALQVTGNILEFNEKTGKIETGRKRMPTCGNDNDNPACMCSYMAPLTPDSKCKCISRYPLLEVVGASQQQADLIEKRFTSEDVVPHWCNSMIIEFMFQNTGTFINALDYIVSLGPINPTCDVLDRLIDGDGAATGEMDRRNQASFIIETTPTMKFLDQYMSADEKINNVRSIYASVEEPGCKLVPGQVINATDEFGNYIYELDENGDKTDKIRTVISQTEWSCDDSDQYRDISYELWEADSKPPVGLVDRSLDIGTASGAGEYEGPIDYDLGKRGGNLKDGTTENTVGCRISGRNDLFCSLGLAVRAFKRYNLNGMRQIVGNVVSTLSGNFEDVTMQEMTQICDFEKFLGALSSAIGNAIPKLPRPAKHGLTKVFNAIAQYNLVFWLRLEAILRHMFIELGQHAVAGTLDGEAMKTSVRVGLDAGVDSYISVVRMGIKAAGDLFTALTGPKGGKVFQIIIGILDIIAEELKNELMDMVLLIMDVVLNFIAAFSGNKQAIKNFFTSFLDLFIKSLTLMVRKMWDILGAILGFFGVFGEFMALLANGVCIMLNAVMGAIDGIISGLTFGMASIGWESMECVDMLSAGRNHTSGLLGKHFLRAEHDAELPRKMAELLNWNGTSVCDHLMTAAADFKFTELRPLERAQWTECMELKFMGIQLASFFNLKSFPEDLFYNWKRKYAMAFDAFRALKLVAEEFYETQTINWGNLRHKFYENGLDPELYMRTAKIAADFIRVFVSSFKVIHISETVLEHFDPDFKNVSNPSSTATAWRTIDRGTKIYNIASKKWTEEDGTQMAWHTVDKIYDSRIHMKHWWNSLGKDVPAGQTQHIDHTQKLFTNLKRNIGRMYSENTLKTKKHNRPPRLRLPILTDVKSCYQRGAPSWCSDCALVDNFVENVVIQGEAMAKFYVNKFPPILVNVSLYFNDMLDYNKDFFEGTAARLAATEYATAEMEKNVKNGVITALTALNDPSIRWNITGEDWKTLFSDLGSYIQNRSNVTHKEIWLNNVERFINASRLYVTTNSSEYVPFYGYGFYYSYNYFFFSKCDMEKSIFTTTTTPEERVQAMDYALIYCAIVILLILTNSTWSVLPLFWMTNVVVISSIIGYSYLWIVYGYFLSCAPMVPYTFMEDIFLWYSTRLDPGCFYKNIPYIAVNASEDTCLTCSAPQVYINCANYTAAGYQEGMLPLSDLIAEYNIAWPSLFYVRWKHPKIMKFLFARGFFEFDSVLGKLAGQAWDPSHKVDNVWIDCYNAMWLDNILFAFFGALALYIGAKMSVIAVQTIIQCIILVTYTYTAINYMSLAVEQSVVVTT